MFRRVRKICEMRILASSRLCLRLSVCLSVRMEQMGVGDMTLDADDVSKYYKNLICTNFQFVPHTEHSVLEYRSCVGLQGNNRPFFSRVSCGTANNLFE